MFSFVKEEKLKGSETQSQNHLVIFFPYKDTFNSISSLEKSFREYFFNNVLPDKLFIICFDFNSTEVLKAFNKNSEIYDYIPKYNYEANVDTINIISIGKRGTITTKLGKNISEDTLNQIYRKGLTRIFTSNGGVITAQSAHHFVFPSGKHSNQFLRTGNVLLHGAEILFIASALVRYFKKEKVTSIYADTSSINSLVYAYINILKDLNSDFSESVLVESFGSYRQFEKGAFDADSHTQFLISSSTSGGILKRMLNPRNSGGKIKRENLVILYGLTVESSFSDRVLCDLKYNSQSNPKGIEPFKSFKTTDEPCGLCTEGSMPLKVEGDVFLLDKPIVSSHTITIKDSPSYLKNFNDFFRKRREIEKSFSLFRCYFKENGTNNRKYEIFLDIDVLFDEWNNRNLQNHPFEEIFNKFEKHIVQCIPASTKYLVCLPDSASRKLANIILEVLTNYYLNTDDIQIIASDSISLKTISKKQKGTIVAVSSSTVTGANLLYLSRALRDFESNYRRLFFTFVSRIGNPRHAEFLQSNLGQGEFGKETHKLFSVEKIFCSDETKQTSWHEEEEKIKSFQDFFEELEGYEKIKGYCQSRLFELTNSGRNRGLSDNLFFPSINTKPLKLRPGFAFSPFQKGPDYTNFINRTTQAEVYFIISTIINELRNKKVLVQGEYVRNVIDPGNFVRYNDGVIQAALLRAAKREELDYSLDKELDNKMHSVLGEMILHLEDEHAEALNEFFYAISIKKMKLSQETLEDCVALLKSRKEFEEDSILSGLVKYIEERVIEKIPVEKKFKPLTAEQVNIQ